MIQMRLNIPPLLEQIRENMLDEKASPTIRFNYSQTMRTIKDYADQAIKEYEKAELKRGR
jgi:hypothetical protein